MSKLFKILLASLLVLSLFGCTSDKGRTRDLAAAETTVQVD